MKQIVLAIVTLFSTICLFAEQKNGIVYVKPGATGTGSSWTDALGNIQEAIDLAKTDYLARKDVWVATGEFTISTCINLADSVNIFGSFEGTETEVSQRIKVDGGKSWEFSHPTILKGNGARLIQATANMDIETIVDGFIMKDGNSIGSSTSGSGGAAMIRPNVILNNCVIKNNTSTSAAGGVMMNGGGTVRNSLIKDNTNTAGSNGGGGIFCNTSTGGKLGYIENCVITGNISTIRGGGIAIQGNTNTYITACEFYNNQAIASGVLKNGSAIYANSNSNEIKNCAIYNNTGVTAIYYAGGNFYNNTIVRNVGGLYLSSTSNTYNVANNMIWGCTTDATGATATGIIGVVNSNIKIDNNITYNPIPEDKSWVLTDNLLFSSNVSNGDVSGAAAGTVGSGPKFHYVTRFYGVPTNAADSLQLDSVNWNINNTSPCLNAGKTVTAVTNDFTGLSRPQGYPSDGAKYDIGAYELPYFIVVAGEATTANGSIYSNEGILIPENYEYGYVNGTQIEYLISPNTGYKAEKVYYTLSTDGGKTFTGAQVDVTSKVDNDGFIKLTVNASFKIGVNWGSLTALPTLNENNVKITVTSNEIQLTGVQNSERVTLINVNGLSIDSKIAKDHAITFNRPQNGLYFIRTTKNTQKIVIF